MNAGSPELGKPGQLSPVLEKPLLTFGNFVLAMNRDTEHGGKKVLLRGSKVPREEGKCLIQTRASTPSSQNPHRISGLERLSDLHPPQDK